MKKKKTLVCLTEQIQKYVLQAQLDLGYLNDAISWLFNLLLALF